MIVDYAIKWNDAARALSGQDYRLGYRSTDHLDLPAEINDAVMLEKLYNVLHRRTCQLFLRVEEEYTEGWGYDRLVIGVRIDIPLATVN